VADGRLAARRLGRAELILANGSLRQAASFGERVAAAAGAGVTAIGWHGREYHALRSAGWTDADLRAVLDDHGVRLVEIETVVGWDDPPDRRTADADLRERQAFALADAVGARHVIAVGSLTGGLRPSAAEGFADLCRRAADHGLLVALEPQACSTIADLTTAVAIVEAADTPNGGLAIDVWHATRGGWGLPALRQLSPERLIMVQLDDGPAQPSRADYLEDTTYHRTVPGEGEFDLTAFLDAVYGTGTAAPLSIEVLSDELDQLPAAAVAARLAGGARTALAAAGIVDDRPPDGR
jgi:sugar phosphate isomerase/epimerase